MNAADARLAPLQNSLALPLANRRSHTLLQGMSRKGPYISMLTKHRFRSDLVAQMQLEIV
jgi:hypothetical protein